jgi:hypothetical protein
VNDALLVYAALGALAGLLAGLLGVGGGLVIVPVLSWSFSAQGLPAAYVMQLALGTSLATIVFTSLASLRAHHGRGAVRWPLVARLAPGVVLGALAGAGLAERLGSELLERLFGVFELAVALHMAFGRGPAAHRQLPGGPGLALAGGLIGLASALFGIGGGTLTVPFLAWCNVPLRQAVATSSAVGLPIALGGAAGFVLAGLDAQLPAWALGYVHLPALAGIAVASMLLAPLGARLAHTLPLTLLRRGFALFLAAVGTRMLLG